MKIYRATAVAYKGRAVLIEGPSGSGKSDLALRLIGRGAILVSDDYVALEKRGSRLFAGPPEKIKGKLEIRGVGIETLAYDENVPVALLISLAPAKNVPRLPGPAFKGIEGVKIPNILVNAFEASAPDKILHLLGKK